MKPGTIIFITIFVMIVIFVFAYLVKIILDDDGDLI